MALNELYADMWHYVENQLSHGPLRDTLLVFRSEIAQIETELDEWHTTSEKVLNDECAPDERHCTCVPFLRKRIAELEDDCKTLARIIYSAAKDLDDVLKGK